MVSAGAGAAGRATADMRRASVCTAGECLCLPAFGRVGGRVFVCLLAFGCGYASVLASAGVWRLGGPGLWDGRIW